MTPLNSLPTQVNMNPSFSEGVFVMSERGKVKYNQKRSHWYVDIHWKGKRHYFSSYLGSTCYVKKMADQLLAEIRGEINKGIFNPLKHKKTKPLNLKTYAEDWLERKEGKLASNTLHDYRNSLDKHIYPILGDPLLENINYDMLEKLQGQIDRTPKGKKNVMYCLYAILRDAKKSGYINQLPERPSFTGEYSVVPPEIRYIESNDIDLIISKIPGEDRAIFEFMKYTGCRTSEARAFRKSDVKEDHIEIRWSFGRDQEDKLVKNRRPRKIPLYDALKQVIDSAPKSLTDYVFVNHKTSTHYGRDFSRIWRKACKDAGLQVAQLRLLRHSFGCNLLNLEDSPIDKEDLRLIYGHADTKMTSRYAERSTKALKLKLDNVFSLRKEDKKKKRN